MWLQFYRKTNLKDVSTRFFCSCDAWKCVQPGVKQSNASKQRALRVAKPMMSLITSAFRELALIGVTCGVLKRRNEYVEKEWMGKNCKDCTRLKRRNEYVEKEWIGKNCKDCTRKAQQHALKFMVLSRVLVRVPSKHTSSFLTFNSQNNVEVFVLNRIFAGVVHWSCCYVRSIYFVWWWCC